MEGEGRERRRGRGGRKGKVGGKGEPGDWGGERKEGRGMEGINLPHGRLKTLAALEIAV